MRSIARTIVALATTSLMIAADAPYIGKWKLNPDKSQLAGETWSIEKTPSGLLKFEMGGISYNFNADGKEYPIPGGGTTSWTALNAKTWECTNRMNGKVVWTFRLSLEGDTVTVLVGIKKPDGGTNEVSGRSARVSGGPGFLGKWRNVEVKGAAMSMELIPSGADGLTLRFPDQGIVCEAKFDGKDYPVSGPMASNKLSFSVKRTGLRSLELTEKLDGKAVYLSKFSVSDDGKSLANNGGAVSTKEPVKAVYDRQ